MGGPRRVLVVAVALAPACSLVFSFEAGRDGGTRDAAEPADASAPELDAAAARDAAVDAALDAGADARQAWCGDTVTDLGEECDDGNEAVTDDCVFCQLARCGDGYVWAGYEVCDDGNGVQEDACLNTCLAAGCGDGFEQAEVEECDDGNGSNEDDCVADCRDASCGDNFIQAGIEQCDDGNTLPSDGCSADCQVEQ